MSSLRGFTKTLAVHSTPLSPTATSPLTGETYSQNLRNGSTSNKLFLFIASDVSTTNSFYGACACKNWVLASGRDAERKYPKGTSEAERVSAKS